LEKPAVKRIFLGVDTMAAEKVKKPIKGRFPKQDKTKTKKMPRKLKKKLFGTRDNPKKPEKK
jgi:hypothetical protein